MAILPDVVNSGFCNEPESGTYEVCSREEAAPDEHVRRVDLETAQGSRLDDLCHKMGLIRVGTRVGILDFGPMAETDVALRNRAIAYGEDWGLLDDEEEPAAAPEPAPMRPAPVLVLCAGGRPRMSVHEDGAVVCDGAVIACWPDLPVMLAEIGGTEWALQTSRVDGALVVHGPTFQFGWDIFFPDAGGLQQRICGPSGKDEPLEDITPQNVGKHIYTIVLERHSEMRANRLGRALFETEPAVVKLVREVTDVRAHDRRGVAISPERTRAAFEKAWSRDEGRLRTVCLTRARQVLHRLGGAVCIRTFPRGSK